MHMFNILHCLVLVRWLYKTMYGLKTACDLNQVVHESHLKWASVYNAYVRYQIAPEKNIDLMEPNNICWCWSDSSIPSENQFISIMQSSKMKIVLLNEIYLLQLLYSCYSMKVTCFSYCIPAALWRLFALLYSCSSIWVTCFSCCIAAAQWMLPASVTVLLLLYESYLLKLL